MSSGDAKENFLRGAMPIGEQDSSQDKVPSIKLRVQRDDVLPSNMTSLPQFPQFLETISGLAGRAVTTKHRRMSSKAL